MLCATRYGESLRAVYENRKPVAVAPLCEHSLQRNNGGNIIVVGGRTASYAAGEYRAKKGDFR